METISGQGMSDNSLRLSADTIHDLRRFDNFITEETAQVGRSPHVNLATENLRKTPLQSGQTNQPNNRIGLKLHQNVNVAVGTEVIPQY